MRIKLSKRSDYMMQEYSKQKQGSTIVYVIIFIMISVIFISAIYATSFAYMRASTSQKDYRQAQISSIYLLKSIAALLSENESDFMDTLPQLGQKKAISITSFPKELGKVEQVNWGLREVENNKNYLFVYVRIQYNKSTFALIGNFKKAHLSSPYKLVSYERALLEDL